MVLVDVRAHGRPLEDGPGNAAGDHPRTKELEVAYDKERVRELNEKLRGIIAEQKISLFTYRRDDESIPEGVHGMFAGESLYGLATAEDDGKKIFLYSELIEREWKEKADLVRTGFWLTS